jgi:hypothetical protein
LPSPCRSTSAVRLWPRCHDIADWWPGGKRGEPRSETTDRSRSPPSRGSQADTSTIGRSAGVSLRLDLLHRPSRRSKAAWRAMPLFGLRASFPALRPSSPFTLTRFPRATEVTQRAVSPEVVPIGGVSPRSQLGWPRFVRPPPVRSITTVARGSVPHRR